jgi:RTX calcium-binding nonapeptide repeat (4 copies)
MRVVAILSAALVLAGAASAARITGTEGADRLTGTARSDTIFAKGGRDRIASGSGPDFLHGGTGRDALLSGPGADRVAASYDGARDTVRCGRGVDVVNADLLDSVAADCELVSRRLSRDPYTTPDSQHETQVEPDSLTVGRATVVTYQVGRRHDGAATNVGFALSRDRGRTWRSGLLPGLTQASRPPGPNERATDPVVAFDAKARVWLISTLSLAGQTTRLTINRSADGLRWSPAIDAATAFAPSGIAFDKNWLACDNGIASPFRGSCYLAYTDALRGDRIAVVTSRDGGITWSQPVGVAVTNAVGAFPVIRPNGDLVVVYLFGRRMGSAISVDGGASFGPTTTIAEVEEEEARGLRFFTLPSADVDPTGRVWATWHDCRFSPGCSSNSVVVSTSTDGRTWTEPAQITTGRNALMPAVGIHPRSGRAAFLYHVVRPGNLVDVELLEVGPDLRRVGRTRRLSAQTMRPTWMPTTVSGRMLADYVSVHYAGGRPLAVWVLATQPVGASLRQAVYATRG